LKINKTTIVFHTVFSGIIALFVSTFFASGTIAENYTDDTFVAPFFFFVLAIWLVGVLFLFLFPRKFHTSINIMWLSIPLGIVIAFPIEALL